MYVGFDSTSSSHRFWDSQTQEESMVSEDACIQYIVFLQFAERLQGKMWCLERDRKRREKVPTSSGRYHELTIVPDTTQRRIVCGRTDGRRAATGHARDREKKSLARELPLRWRDSCDTRERKKKKKKAAERKRGKRKGLSCPCCKQMHT
jgi:hypothetical protein